MIKKLGISILIGLWVLALPLSIFAQTELAKPVPTTISTEIVNENSKIKVEVFERIECQHCKDAKEFFNDYIKENQSIEVTYYDLVEAENKLLWEELAELENIPKVTPIILIGNTVVQGFDKPNTTGVLIKDLIAKTNPTNSKTFKEFIEAGGSGELVAVDGGTCTDEECLVDTTLPPVAIPFTDITIQPQDYSLASMSLILGFIDGFNPCAMWVLVTFLIVLMQVGDRKKMWQIAGLFIVAEAIMYYMILNVWFSVWDFVGLDNIITPIVGLIAIGGGSFFLWEWYSSDGSCKVTNSTQRAKTHKRISKIVEAEMTLVTAIAIIGLALSVNIIEFACSVGIPQAFTKILDINLLSFIERQFYMLLYILMYMVDDFIVFGIALYSFEKIGITTKYSKLSNLIGGILMLILGSILMLKPELLVF